MYTMFITYAAYDYMYLISIIYVGLHNKSDTIPVQQIKWL